jgi:Planctomycete cytochrome C/Anaphase-promoting complex subunit 4 WD40 domain
MLPGVLPLSLWERGWGEGNFFVRTLRFRHGPSVSRISGCNISFKMEMIAAVCGSFLVLTAAAEDKINYTDHIEPVIEANCARCHNTDKKKADLDLTSYQSLLKGSGSGVIVLSGNPDGSKLWKALTHAEEPFMPPNRPKLADKDLDLFKKWIAGGLLETAGGTAIAAVKSGVDLALNPDELSKPDGPPPMPQDLPIDPVVHTRRGTAITGLASSPWAPLIAIAGQKQILLFDSDTFELLGILPFAEGEPVMVEFSRNGKLLLAGGGRAAKSGRVVVWDVVTGEKLMTLGKEYDSVLAADIRPDQSQVALGGPSRLVKILSTKSGEVLHQMKKHTDWVTAAAYSPNGQILATADRNGGISLWDPDSGQELFTLAGHKAAVTALSWRPDSKLLASSSEDGTIKLWEVQEGKQVKSWNAHRSGALCVAYSRDGQLASCGRDNAVTLWNANGGKQRAFKFSGDIPLRVAFSHDTKRIIATDFSGRVAVWEAKDGKRLGDLDADPLPLAEQLAAACRRVRELGAGTNTEATAKLGEAKTAVQRLEAAQLRSTLYQARESLAAKKREHDQLAATLATNEQTLRQAQKDLAAARDAAAKADAQIRAARAATLRTEPAAKRLTAQIAVEQTRLDRLMEQYRAATAGPERLAQRVHH